MSKNQIRCSSRGLRIERVRKSLLITSRVLAAIMSVVFGVLIAGSQIAYANQDTVTSFLGQDYVNYVKVDRDDGEEVSADYYTSGYGSVKEVREAGMAMTERVMNEGAVLLKNDNGALPLNTAKDKVTMFSVSSAKPVYSGNREDYDKSSSVDVDLFAGLKNAGITVNDDLYNWYKQSSYGKQYVLGNSIYVITNINEAPWSALPNSRTKDGFNTAMFVLSRIGGEGVDNTVRDLGEADNDKLRGNYLILNETEKEIMRNIKELKNNGRFDKFIVLMNTTNQVALDFLDEYDVDAVLYCGGLGSRGANAVGNILTGKVNPSGKLSDTFWKNHYLNPTLTNWGAMSYNGGNSITSYVGFTYDNNGKFDDSYVVYQEGIYSGYRYTETRYEDYVTGSGNAGEFNYYDAVAYPFGYGLSYTTFGYSDMEIEYDEETDEYVISVTVTNIGSVTGKNSAQLFLQRPYTDYDKDSAHRVEKEAVKLVDFGKTEVLAGGASQELTMRVARREFASYDSYGNRTYILEEGDYYFTVAQDAHAAINNILAAKGYTVADGMDAEGDASLVKKVNDVQTDEFLKYSTADKTGKEITNVFDDADPKIYEKGEANGNAFEYITRSDWTGTVKYAYDLQNFNYLNNYVRLTKSAKIENAMNRGVEKDDGKYPTYGAAKKWQLIDLRVDENGERVPYDDPRWDELLDSLTFKEMADLLSNGFAQTKMIASISKPATYDYDSDVGVIGAY